jgi:exosortase A
MSKNLYLGVDSQSVSATALAQIRLTWRQALLSLGLLLAWLFFWYRNTAMDMAAIWSRSDTYAHGFVVPLISLWLIWRQRERVRNLVPTPGAMAWVLMAGCAALWLLGDLVAVNAATQFTFTAMLVLAVPSVLGWPVAWALLFPLTFLFFAVPIGDFMLPQLMQWTADFTVLALRLSGIPVYREGQQFVIPSGNWSVVEACSGVRYLIASVTVGCLFAYLNYQSTRRRLVFVGIAILVPIVANWLRAYMIVMLGHYSGNTIAMGVDHLIYGWLFFGIVITVMFLLGARWAQPAPSVLTGPSAQGTLRPDDPTSAKRLAIPVAALVVALLVAVPQVVDWSLGQAQNIRVPVLTKVASQGGWQQASEPPADWKPAFANASVESQTGYIGPGGATVGLYIGYYRNQNYQRKLVTSENALVKSMDKHWARVSDGASSMRFERQPLTVRTAELRRLQDNGAGDELRLVVWQFYWVNDHRTASDALAKIYGALGRLMGQGDDGAVVMVYTPKSPSATAGKVDANAETILRSFVDAHSAVIEAVLQQTRGQR